MTQYHAKIGILIIAAVIFVLFAIGMILPRDYKVDAVTTINKPQAEVMDSLLNLRTWNTWSPWNTEDKPGVKFTYSGPDKGAGSTFRWRGESVGAGGLTITHSSEEEGIRYELDRGDQEDIQYGTFTFKESSPTSTTVTWTITGRLPSNPLVRWAGLFADAIRGGTFQQALDQFKTRVEE